MGSIEPQPSNVTFPFDTGHPPFDTTFGSLLTCISDSCEMTSPCKAIDLSIEKAQRVQKVTKV